MNLLKLGLDATRHDTTKSFWASAVDLEPEDRDRIPNYLPEIEFFETIADLIKTDLNSLRFASLLGIRAYGSRTMGTPGCRLVIDD